MILCYKAEKWRKTLEFIFAGKNRVNAKQYYSIQKYGAVITNYLGGGMEIRGEFQ